VSDANRDPIGTPDLYAVPDLPESLERVVLPIDKPLGLSSFGVIRRLRRILGVRKIGHAGTLDPMATGLLIMLVGRATKQMEHFMGMRKVYTGIIRLGETTPSYDAETEVVERRPTTHLSEQDIITATSAFTGDIEQLPPMYSAVKVGGERLYKKARRGEEIERRPRQVRVDRFDITKVDGPDVHFEIACSKGTYIRSLANDLGKALEVGGHLVALRRTHIGDISVDTAWTLDALREALPTSESTE
jgi:tRNA pseudouridine55 synthase